MAKRSTGTQKGTSHGAKDGSRLPTAKLAKLRVVGLNGDWRCACGRRYEADFGCDNCRILAPCRLYLFEKCPHGSTCSHPHPSFDLSAQHFVSPTDEAQAAKDLVRPSKLKKALARLRRKQHGQQDWGRESSEGGGQDSKGHGSSGDADAGVWEKLGVSGVWEEPWPDGSGYESWACSGVKAGATEGEGGLIQSNLEAASKAARKREENRKRNERRRRAQADGKQQGRDSGQAGIGEGGPQQGSVAGHGDSVTKFLGAGGMVQQGDRVAAHPASVAGADWAALLSTEAAAAAGPAAKGAAGGAWTASVPTILEVPAHAEQGSCLSVASQEALGLRSTQPVGLKVAADAVEAEQGGRGGEDEELQELLLHLGIEPALEQAAGTAVQPLEALAAAAAVVPAAAAAAPTTLAAVHMPVSSSVQARPAGKYTPLGVAAAVPRLAMLPAQQPRPPLASAVAAQLPGPALTAAAPACSPQPALTPAAAAVAVGLHEEPGSPDSQGQCVVCWDAPAQTVMAPCGHQVLCVTCARTVLGPGRAKPCPMCREEVREYVVLGPG